MRLESVQCDRCGVVGSQLGSQNQEGWRHIQVWDITNKTPKDAGSYDLCFSCKREWEMFIVKTTPAKEPSHAED